MLTIKNLCVKVVGFCRLNLVNRKWLQQSVSCQFFLLLLMVIVADAVSAADAAVVTVVAVFFVVCRAHAVQQSGVLSSQRIMGAVYHVINYMSPFSLFNILLIIFITDFYFI